VPGGLGDREVGLDEFAVGGTPPQLQRGRQPFGGLGGSAVQQPATLGRETLEPGGIDDIAGDGGR
jgi:hypothetical protein